MSRLLWLSAATLAVAAVSLPLARAEASPLDDLARQSYRLGVAALDAIDATPSQRKAVASAAKRLQTRLGPFEADARDLARSAHQVWVADVVTREAVEAVRVDSVELIDDTSAETVDFVVDVARTLTPQQRAELARKARNTVRDLLAD